MLNLDFSELYELSISHPEKVWDVFGQQVVWHKPYTSVIDDKESPTQNWFVGGEINMSYNCLDKSIEEGYGNDVAVIYESPATNTTQKITYKELLESVELLAGVMVQKCNIKKGDRVLLYFPVIPQCLIGMLACTRIGAIYSPVFGGFSSKSICSRINHIQPKLILTCNVGFETGMEMKYKEKIDTAIEMSEFKPDYCIVYNRPNSEVAYMVKERDFDWVDESKVVSPQGPIPVESNHPMFIIYTSGTTGEPKGLVVGTGNSVVVDKYNMVYIMNLKPRECWWMFGDFGWITGQTIMSYGPLLSRVTTIIYEGKPVSTPDAGQIVRIMNRHKVVSFMSSPTIMRMLRNNCKETDLRLSYGDLRVMYIGGEVTDLDLKQWISNSFKCPVHDLWAQTELCTTGISSAYGFKRADYSTCIPMLNINPVIVNTETGNILPRETIGRLLLKIPNTPSMALTFYKDHDRFLRTYFHKYPGFYDTMDYAILKNDGSLQVLSRADDIIHVAAARVCGGAVEEICLQNENVIEAAVVPLDDLINGQVPFAFLVKRSGPSLPDKKIITETVELVNKSIGEFCLFQHAVIVSDFPKTKSGKISRSTLASMVNGKEYKVPATVENEEIYVDIYDILQREGYKATLPIDL